MIMFTILLLFKRWKWPQGSAPSPTSAIHSLTSSIRRMHLASSLRSKDSQERRTDLWTDMRAIQASTVASWRLTIRLQLWMTKSVSRLRTRIEEIDCCRLGLAPSRLSSQSSRTPSKNNTCRRIQRPSPKFTEWQPEQHKLWFETGAKEFKEESVSIDKAWDDRRYSEINSVDDKFL